MHCAAIKGSFFLINCTFGRREYTLMSTNVSKQKREELLAKIKAIRTYIATAPQDENTANLLAYLSELEKDVGAKKYGLVFEEHREEIDEVLSTHTPVLTEDGSLFIDNGGQMNFLIEGDNLASLQLLEKTHKGKIDVIYIDPPYNTGSKDFIYNDTYVDKLDGFRHSKWLSFMSSRLTLAKKLLNEQGSIFISIDDNEYSQLKILCDSIFGENNFVANVIWKHTQQSKNDERHFSRQYNCLLIYAKNIDTLPQFLFARTDEDNKNYRNPDNDPRGDWRSGDVRSPNYRPTMCYDIVAPNGNVIKAPEKGWRWSKETLDAMIETGEIVFKPDFSGIIRKIYLCNQKGRTPENLWDGDRFGTTRQATADIKDLFNGKAIFDTPKPKELIMRIIEIALTNKNGTVLDFFAGSGTTGHAVLKYNSENSEYNCKFILCTNNENNICRDITYERIKRVIDKEGYAASLKYFKVEYIPVSERMYYEYADELLSHIRELVELENGINFTGNAEIGIVLTEDELAAFIANGEAIARCRKLYMGHDILPDEEQEKILRERGVEISIIPDYYYRNLQEGRA